MLAALIVTTSCSGHGTAAMVPSAQTAQSHSQTQSLLQTTSPSLGLGTTKAPTLAAAPSGWATTATQAIPMRGTDLGVVSPSQPVTVRVGLQLRNVGQLQSAIASRTRVKPAAFASQYGPSSAQVNAVTSYLSSQGFTNITVEPNNVLVSATGTAAQASQAFNTTLHSFSLNGKNVYANVTPAYVPAALGGNAIAVLGLNNVPAMNLRGNQDQPTACSLEGVSTPNQACLRNYDPATFHLAYDAGNTSDGSGVSVGIMTWGDVTQAVQFLRLNEQEFNLSQAAVNVKLVGTPSPNAGSDATSEWTLDMTYSSGMAQNVQQLVIYQNTSGTDSDLALGYSRWVTDDVALVGNSSFGECELYPYLDGSMVLDDELLAEAAAQGQTMFVSTGDTGSFCPVAGVGENGVPAGGGAGMVNYPASSPYVTAVGGTDLFSNADGTYAGETAWEAGGGGISLFEYQPSWDANAQTLGGYRGIPDVAMDASLETGALLWGGAATNGSCTPCITGGTSLASPLAAGAYARIQTAHAEGLGFAPPLFYNNYATNTAGAIVTGPPPTEPYGGFHDILAGANGAYAAQPGYDYTTGLGSIDIAVLSNQL